MQLRDPSLRAGALERLARFADRMRNRLRILFVRQGTPSYRLVNDSPLFDAVWYRARYSDVAANADALVHYLRNGAREGRNPGPLFDTTWYLTIYPDVARTGQNPLLHYLEQGWREGRQPNALFATAWYLSTNPDLVKAGVEPAAHYALLGWREGRNPSPLFNGVDYVARYPDVRATDQCPLAHYLQYGAAEGREPTPHFDGAWYLERYPDVAAAQANPLAHYLQHGWREGRNPSPRFDAARYRRNHPDIDVAGIDPLLHYLSFGRKEDRPFPLAMQPLTAYLPSRAPAVAVSAQAPHTLVIVPVYRGYDETMRCIDTVLADGLSQSPHALLVINDASPEPELTARLRERAAAGEFRYFENPENLGFVGTVNRGMREAGGSDVVLLNSDTEVPAGWLDRLRAHLADGKVGSVTALSNNATICSYPDFNGRRALPEGETLAGMDAAAQAANLGRHVEIPTAVGFCMLIPRACLADVGLFDEERFGRGYGEENDFCMRASARGWRHLLACDTFVFHAGETSFQGSASEGKTRAAAVLRERHPAYFRRVAAHVAEDPGAACRVALTAARWRADARPALLVISHALGGGTEKHVREVAGVLSRRYRLLYLRPARAADGGVVELSSDDGYAPLRVSLDAAPLADLAQLLRSFGVVRAHIHHVYGFRIDVEALLREARVPFDFTAHDYYPICPQINLVTPAGRYCGEPATQVCDRCIRTRVQPGAQDIRTWRLRHQWLLRDAERVLCPSADTAARLARYEPEARYVVVPHEAPADAARRLVPVLPADRDRFRIAIIGVLAVHKGRDLVLAMARHAALFGLPVEFVVIGEVDGVDTPEGNLRAIGKYSDDRLDAIIDDVDPHLVWFPAQWPETYSYTLSAALRSRRPVAAPALGAFVERLVDMPWSWLLPLPEPAPEQFVATLLAVCERYIGPGFAPPLPIRPVRPDLRDAPPRQDFEATYLGGRAPRLWQAVTDLRRNDGVPSVLVVAEWLKQAPSPCAAIRLLLPLEAMGTRVHWRVVGLEECERYRADIVLSHRTALTHAADVDRLVAHANRWNMPLVYDLDDNFLDLDPAAENGKYREWIAAVQRFLETADEVWVSTSALADRVAALTRARPQVMPNRFEPDVWGANRPWTPEPSDREPVSIVCMGTRTHAEDFALVEPALMKLKARHGARVDLHLIGVVPLDSEPSIYHAPYPPALVGGSYPAFVSWLQSINRWHIGLAPLVDTPFNRCKSEIKAIDYAALGLVPVVSDLAPYHDAVMPGVDGLLVGPDADAWFEALDTLVTDGALRRRLRAQAQRLPATRFNADDVHARRLLRLLHLAGAATSRTVALSA